MPFPNEHSCRLRDPGDFQADSFRRTTRDHEGKQYSIIMGRLKGETSMTEQAYRYPKDSWSASQARSHCSDHDGSFEAASGNGENVYEPCDSCAEREALEQYRKGTAPAPVLQRDEGYILTKQGNKDDGSMTFVASEESEDRTGDVISASGWELDNFKKNPVFLYMHDQTFPPLGTWAKVSVEGKQLLAVPKWDEQDDFATLIKGKYERGVMRGVSVGFRAMEFEERPLKEPLMTPFGRKTTGMFFKKQELVEISAVSVPAHPKALRKALGRRAQFWIPFQIEAESKAVDLRTRLEEIRLETEALLKTFQARAPAETDPVPIEALDIDALLYELRSLKEA